MSLESSETPRRVDIPGLEPIRCPPELGLASPPPDSGLPDAPKAEVWFPGWPGGSRQALRASLRETLEHILPLEGTSLSPQLVGAFHQICQFQRPVANGCLFAPKALNAFSLDAAGFSEARVSPKATQGSFNPAVLPCPQEAASSGSALLSPPVGSEVLPCPRPGCRLSRALSSARAPCFSK